MSQLVCPEMVMRMANIVVDVASRVCVINNNTTIIKNNKL